MALLRDFAAVHAAGIKCIPQLAGIQGAAARCSLPNNTGFPRAAGAEAWAPEADGETWLSGAQVAF